MKKILFILLAAVVLTGFAQAATVTEGPGLSFYVNGLYDGMTFQVDMAGYLYSNGDGTYSASCPMNLPIDIKDGKFTAYLYSGGVNKITVKSGSTVLNWVKDDYYFDIRYDVPRGNFDLGVSGQTTYQKVNTKFVIKGKKYGPNDFYIDCNGVQGSGQAKVRVLIGGVKKFEKTYNFDSDTKITESETPRPTPIPKITPKPTPTPQPTKSPGQTWAERNCWWYRVK